MHLIRKAKKDILSENIYFFFVGKTDKGKFSYKSHFKFQPHCKAPLWAMRGYIICRDSSCSIYIFLDIGAYTGCLTNVFIIEWKMNLSLMELNPTWTAATGTQKTGLVDSLNKNTEMNAIYSAGILIKIWSSSPVIINCSSLNVCNSPVAHRYAICLCSLGCWNIDNHHKWSVQRLSSLTTN